MRKPFLSSVMVAVATVIVGLVGPVAQAGSASVEGHGAATVDKAVEAEAITVAEFAELAEQVAAQRQKPQPPEGGWEVPSDRAYHLLPSCEPYAGAISQGASAWADLNETSGQDTPVECRDSYITDCGGGGRIVGCNWGQGQRIALYMGGVSDDALLAAHEFGHDWYGHSSYQCAGWSSPEHVMAPTMCNGPGVTKNPIRID